MQRPIPLVVFSDLDGTLLDHDTYSWAPAQPALDRLAAKAVPVVLATSKTAPETLLIQKRMDLSRFPAIVENGAGIIGLGADVDEYAKDYNRLRACLDDLPKGLRQHFTGFGDMDVGTVAQITGLPDEDAARAKARAFSEPGLWSGPEDEKADFLTSLSHAGITARAGGRFLTLSYGKTKKDGMDEIAAQLGARITMALGDAPNDIDMLEAADHGVIVYNPHHPPLPELQGEQSGRIIRTTQTGPAGWNAAVNAFLDAQDQTLKD